jgi:Holliday junction resolvasome RuvABC endonuclease subunit
MNLRRDQHGDAADRSGNPVNPVIPSKTVARLNVLALDMASATGFAALKGGNLFSGTWRNPASHAREPGRFFREFHDWLIEAQRWYAPEIVAWEFTPPARGIAATMIHVGMVTRVQEWAWRNDLRTMDIYPGTLKKFITGRGNAEKEDVREFMRERWNKPCLEDLDESDALAVLAWAVSQKGKR